MGSVDRGWSHLCHLTSLSNSQTRKDRSKPKPPKDFHVENILDKHVCNNTKALTIPTARSKQYTNSFFVKTAIDWNHLPDAVVQAGAPEAFKIALKEHRQQ
jgi:hypothetical protein